MQLQLLHAVYLILIFSLLSIHGEASCQLNIRPSTVSDSWQSSSYVDNQGIELCFKNSSQYFTQLKAFFHSAVAKAIQASGYHWFVVRLKQPVLATSVVITIRANTENEDLLSRSANIEVWTSPFDTMAFGSDNCNSREVSAQFEDAQTTHWSFCGSSPSVDSVSTGMQLVVKCNHLDWTQYLLLRKYVGNETRQERMCMEFSDLWISTLDVRVEIESDKTLIQNSSLTVRCSVSCGSPSMTVNSTQLRLCHPKGECYKTWEIKIDSLQPSDSGNFTCQTSGHAVSSENLSVLYPPAELTILPSGRNLTCSVEFPGNANFTFASSAAQPQPEHWCREFHNLYNYLTLVKLSEISNGTNGSVTSYWQCVGCVRDSASSVKLICGTSQPGLWNMTAEKSALPCETAVETNNLRNVHDSIYMNLSDSISSSLVHIALIAAGIFVLTALVLIVVGISTRLRNSPPTIRCDHATATTADAKPPGSVLPENSSLEQQLDCEYVSVRRSSHPTERSNGRDNSSVTVYMEIVRDDSPLEAAESGSTTRVNL